MKKHENKSRSDESLNDWSNQLKKSDTNYSNILGQTHFHYNNTNSDLEEFYCYRFLITFLILKNLTELWALKTDRIGGEEKKGKCSEGLKDSNLNSIIYYIKIIAKVYFWFRI